MKVNDFGFTNPEENSIKVDDRLDQIYELVIKFLEPLQADPSAKSIKWPSRVDDINKFKEKITNIKNKGI